MGSIAETVPIAAACMNRRRERFRDAIEYLLECLCANELRAVILDEVLQMRNSS
jgi:hypothetical protein